TDPYDGAPLRYRMREGGVVLYSVAQDLQDNGGTFDGKAGATKGTDLGFTLWDVSHPPLLPLPPSASTPDPHNPHQHPPARARPRTSGCGRRRWCPPPKDRTAASHEGPAAVRCGKTLPPRSSRSQ